MKDLEKYKGVTFKGSHLPDAELNNNVKIVFTSAMIKEYIPTIERVMKGDPRGFRLLLIIIAAKEGFTKGSRSYRTNNPGNIGNTDSGKNVTLKSLEEGILLQRSYILRIVNGKSKAYPLGKKVTIKPFYSKEIAATMKLTGRSPWLPGYIFTFTGQLDQFVKIYSTGARAGNGYLNTIVSYFKNHGIEVNSETTIQEIINGL